MFAIVAASGKQYRVAPGDIVVLDRVDAEEGATITLDEVLLVSDKDTKVGAPTVAGAKVEAKVLEHFKGDKVVAFKYKRRQRYRRRVGFRHSHTRIEITGISA